MARSCALVVGFWVEDFGFAEALPFGEEGFGALVVGYAALEQLGLLRCHGAQRWTRVFGQGA